MSEQRALLLALYGSIAAILMIVGLIYREYRDYRERHRTPKQLSFEDRKDEKHKDSEHPVPVSH